MTTSSQGGLATQPQPARAPLPHERRYERKYRIEIGEREMVEAVVRTHPVFFHEVHTPRLVNNIYYDTPDGRFYREHMDGVNHRIKVRRRWYGDNVVHDSLEIKGKEGLIVSKQRFDPRHLPDNMSERLHGLVPVLFNRYRRRYFVSRDGLFRATVDTHMEFGGPEPGDRRRFHDPAIVLELKYPVDLHGLAADVAGRFPFPLSKNSKYITGVTLLRRTP